MIDKFIKDLIQKTIIEFKKKENKDLLENEILNPIFSSFSDRIYPYVSLLFIMYSVYSSQLLLKPNSVITLLINLKSFGSSTVILILE